MKKQLFKTIGLTLICGVFIFLAYGSGDNDKLKLKDATKEEIIKVLSSIELTENYDDSAGYGLLTNKISLKMNEDKTFMYSFRVEKDGGYFEDMNAKGTYELVGDVSEEMSGWGTDKYGQTDERPTYTQNITFHGTTNSGKSFTLKASLIQFTKEGGSFERCWFFNHESYFISNQMSTSIENFRVPKSDICP